MIEAGLVAARFLHFAAVMALFGLALFPLYSRSPRTSVQPAGVSRWLRASVQCATVLGLLSALARAWFAIAGMTGTMLAAAEVDSLFTVLRETSFAKVWVARLVLGVALFALIMRRSNEHHSEYTIVLLAGLLLVSLALVGHTQTNDGVLWIIHMSADGAHLLAAGAWFGGLLALGHLLMLVRRFPSAQHNAQALVALVRFSGMGYAAVATLIGSGLVNAWLLVGSPGKLTTTPYGQLLLMKVCLLAGMLALAAQNRFRLVPTLQQPSGCPWAGSSLRTLRRNVLGEQMLGLAVVLIVGWLGTLQPATSSSQ